MDFPIFSSSLSLGKTISQALCTQSLVLLALWAVEKKMALGNEVGKLLLRELSPVKGARSLSFLDMDEDVSFDLLLLILVRNSFLLIGRERWISSSRGQGVRVVVIFCSYRTTFPLRFLPQGHCYASRPHTDSCILRRLIKSLEWRVR